MRLFSEELAGIDVPEGRIAPILLPDYTTEEVRSHQLTARYEGTIR